MKKYIAIIIIIIVICGFVISDKFFIKKQPANQLVSSEQSLKLPESWNKIEDTATALKYQKRMDTGLKPEIVLIKSTLSDTSTPAKYTDRLIAGAKSAIPSLKITSDNRYVGESSYSAIMSGYYYNNKTKINLLQRIYVRGETVSTLTASYTGNLDSEINSIFDSIISSQHLSN